MLYAQEGRGKALMSIDVLADADDCSFERQRSCAIGCLGIIGVSLLALVFISYYRSYSQKRPSEYRNERVEFQKEYK